MEITSIIGIGIIGTVLAVTLKNYRPELAVCSAAATGLAILLSVLPMLSEIISEISLLCAESQISVEYFKIIIKIIGTAYLTQFAAELAKDSGEGAIAKKIELAGKVFILAMITPTIKNLLGIILNTLDFR